MSGGTDERPLSQEEIDALLQRLQEDHAPPPQFSDNQADASASLESTLPKVTDRPQIEARPLGVWEQVGDFPVRLSVEIGRAVAPLATWRKLGVGSRVTLDRMVLEPVSVRLNGHLVGDGVVVLIGNRFGVQVKQWGNTEGLTHE